MGTPAAGPSSWQGWGWEPDLLHQGSAGGGGRRFCPQGMFSHIWEHFGCASGGGRGALASGGLDVRVAAQPSPGPGTAPRGGIVQPVLAGLRWAEPAPGGAHLFFPVGAPDTEVFCSQTFSLR